MMSLPKTMENSGKMRTSVEPNKIYIIGKFWWELFKNVIFIEFEPLCQKFWAFMSNLPKPHTKYGHVRWPWLQIPKIFFRLILYQILGKVTKFGGIGSRTKMLQAKNKLRVENTPPPSAYRVNAISYCRTSNKSEGF